jgi:hypothetical protein
MLAQISPTTVFFIEGCGQLGYAMCWGTSMRTLRFSCEALQGAGFV